jgi:hypothetical protein
MSITDAPKQILNVGIIPIEVLIWRPEDEHEVFIFLGEFSEYIDILIKLNIKSVFVEKRIVREDDFVHYLDEEEADLLENDPNISVDEEGMIDLIELEPELVKYKSHIGEIMEYRIIAIIEGKEFQIKLEDDWGRELNIGLIRAVNGIEGRIEDIELQREKNKKKRH